MRGARGPGGSALAVAMLLGVGAVLAIVPWAGVFHAPDSSHYLQLAAGRTDVMQPFVSRQLGARVAAGLGLLLGGDLHAGFLVRRRCRCCSRWA